MTSTPIDLEIFILTYNREAMLKRAITSCLNQTIKGIPITVLDNASTDNTKEVVAAFKEPNLNFVGSEENIGGLNNMKRAQMLSSRKYVMIFHDDDQLHPRYLENAYQRLKASPEARIAVANAATVDVGSAPNQHSEQSDQALQLDKQHFAAALYVRNKIAFCSAIYRRDALRSVNFDTMVDTFGKWGDRPIMIEAVGSGSAILFRADYVYSGRHDSQDTHQQATQPSHLLWLNREKYFRDLLGEKASTFPGLCFLTMNHRRLKSGYKRRIKKGVNFKTYLHDAFSIGATSHRSWRWRWFAARPVQRLMNSISARYLLKHFSSPDDVSARSEA